MEKKITKREVLESIVAAIEAGTATFGEVDVADVKAFAENEIVLLDKKAVKAKERAAAKKAEGDELTEVIKQVLGDELETIADITARIEGPDVSVHKVTYRLNALYKAGEIEKGEVVIPATEDTKARKVVGFCKLAD